MCSFCKNFYTGDDYEPIIHTKIDCGLFGSADADVYIAREHKTYPYLILGLCQDKGDGTIEVTEQINYCPMCGRDLLYEKAKGVPRDGQTI